MKPAHSVVKIAEFDYDRLPECPRIQSTLWNVSLFIFHFISYLVRFLKPLGPRSILPSDGPTSPVSFTAFPITQSFIIWHSVRDFGSSGWHRSDIFFGLHWLPFALYFFFHRQTESSQQLHKQPSVCSPQLPLTRIHNRDTDCPGLVICLPSNIAATFILGSRSNVFSSNNASKAIPVLHRKIKWMSPRNIFSSPPLESRSPIYYFSGSSYSLIKFGMQSFFMYSYLPYWVFLFFFLYHGYVSYLYISTHSDIYSVVSLYGLSYPCS